MSAALRYKQHTRRRQLTATWRGYGAACRAHEYCLAVSLYAPGLGADPTGGPSLCAHPARRADAVSPACGSVGSSPHAEPHDLPPAAVVGLALHEASPAYADHYTPQSRWKTRPSGPSPGTFASHHRARGAAGAVYVWTDDVRRAQAVPYASSA